MSYPKYTHIPSIRKNNVFRKGILVIYLLYDKPPKETNGYGFPLADVRAWGLPVIATVRGVRAQAAARGSSARLARAARPWERPQPGSGAGGLRRQPPPGRARARAPPGPARNRNIRLASSSLGLSESQSSESWQP